MNPDLRNLYVMFLHAATDAIHARNKRAAMFCLGQALRCANTVHGDSSYRRAVMRAMSYTRRINWED